jgi:hypothetical protein
MRGQGIQPSLSGSKRTRLSHTLHVLLPSLIACLLLLEPLLCFTSCPGAAERPSLWAAYDILENTGSTASGSAAFLDEAASGVSHSVAVSSCKDANCSPGPNSAPSRPHALHAHDHLAALTVIPIVTLALLRQVRAPHDHSAVPSSFTAPLLRPPLRFTQ